MIIRNILIITVIAALVPTAMSNVSAPADAEIALFSGVSDSDGLSISGNGDSAKMELKATNDNGKSNRISDFQLTADNVLTTEAGDKATIIDNVDFTRAITTDGNNNQKAIGITSNGVIDFAGYNQGVYTLDVVVDDDRAYEAIIAIGDQTNQIVDKEITRVNYDYTIKFGFLPIEDPKPPKCDEGEELIDGKCVPIECDEGEELIDGKCTPVDSCGCPIGHDCPAVVCEQPIPCDEGFEREGDECIPIPDTCMGGPPGLDGCPPVEPEPEPIECGEGEELVDEQCQPIATNPVEPDDLVPIGDEDDNSDDQAIIDEGDTDESENEEQDEDESGVNEGSEESGGSDNEGSEESGGSDGETSE